MDTIAKYLVGGIFAEFDVKSKFDSEMYQLLYECTVIYTREKIRTDIKLACYGIGITCSTAGIVYYFIAKNKNNNDESG